MQQKNAAPTQLGTEALRDGCLALGNSHGETAFMRSRSQTHSCGVDESCLGSTARNCECVELGTPLQYFGIFGSTRSAQARIPPARLWTFLNPAWRRKFTALALRTPERQWATISRLESSSWTRLGRSPSGTRYPLMLQIWYSCGSRT